MKERNLILVRHGQSEWNAKNLFTGWENPGLTDKGLDEAKNAGILISNLNIKFDFLFTSALIRAQLTGSKILEKIGQENINIIKNKSLNERFYGDLQGLNKDECRKKWGLDQVQIWRRSYDVGPPGGESLKECGERVLPYFLDKIYPLVLEGKNIIVSAHGNSLRSLIKHLDKLSADEIIKLEIPTGAPIHYLFSDEGLILTKKNLIE
ncbi:MAG: 2,3-bisphosphoglycerate-dependent phosphoglycerate mutase [Gammaproteobacteria bacterium]|jgi:2,3-bisphosphoglycerate-dependent phosphoglycerate mutase|nr:MAG: 2,3-bisphosphoglycerate-dependent phosphoglycerate mutase [Gammaproteobacteria bacterium TMED225]|tara:strand:- start:1342 stop:1965 length:624 start_codon:yes stop_codon:yes gene_type:complete